MVGDKDYEEVTEENIDNEMKNKSRIIVILGILLVVVIIFSMAPYAELNPGVERWPIKTSLSTDMPKKKTVSIEKLLVLKNPIDRYGKVEEGKYDAHLIPKAVDDGLKEGDIITTKAWLHLVALENDSDKHRDGDYHIQITSSQDSGDNCFIIEVPLPEFVADKDLAAKCGKVREFIRTRLLKGREPGTHGNVIEHPVFVSIKGQLFFDAPHVKGNPRGKRGMKSHTPWELHPIFEMAFASKPR